MNKHYIGSYYEKIAVQYLEKHGYKVIEKNYRCRLGEIDLIAWNKEYLVFVEVKYRSNTNKGYPEEAVNRAKQKKIYQVASQYLVYHKFSSNIPCRFDVVSILGTDITLIQNAFGGF